ncbi:MAG: hypothetical protein Q8908_11125 [Bacteroidota bacterium]|nr:hypothetical protein [Bacteroidota bacterium]
MKAYKTANVIPSLMPDENDPYPDYPIYPPEEDIYNNFREASQNPEDFVKEHLSKPDKSDENDFGEDLIMGDLDVTGSELDKDEGEREREDEENNYEEINEEELKEHEED